MDEHSKPNPEEVKLYVLFDEGWAYLIALTSTRSQIVGSFDTNKDVKDYRVLVEAAQNTISFLTGYEPRAYELDVTEHIRQAYRENLDEFGVDPSEPLADEIGYVGESTVILWCLERDRGFLEGATEIN